MIILHLVLISLLAHSAPPEKAENTQAAFMLYYQPLQDLDRSESRTYIRSVRKLLVNSKDPKLKKLLQGKEKGKTCLRKGLNTCKFFSDPVFNRIDWNKFALSINIHCNLNKSKDCPGLATLHDSFMKKYLKLVRNRKKEREKKKKGLFKKINKGK